MTEGIFIDPQGRPMPLRASTPDAFRVLVTRKLEQGWKLAAQSPAVVPLTHDETWAVAPAPAPAKPVAPVVELDWSTPEAEVPSDEDRLASAAAALAGDE